ncbi:MAG: OmpA family protein [Bacteroidales bacterium]|nr:OmpA family protein [Bacteroidales bacterium]
MNKFFISIIIFIMMILNIDISAQSACETSGINNPEMLVNYLSVSFDSKLMIYAKKVKVDFQYAFFEHTFNNKNWSEAKEIKVINDFIKPTHKLGGTCFNYNATVFYFSIDIGDGNGMDIYSVEKSDGEWRNLKKNSDEINSNENESDPSISPDGNTFFFVRDVSVENDFTEEFNCKTIYISEKSLDGNWEKPYRMSRKINSGCEMSPRISSDNKTLFFSSVRGDAKMGFDIYSTKMVAKGIWSEPSRIDTVSNEYSNIYPNVSFNGDKMFYINQTKLGKKKEEDILFNSFLPKKNGPEKNLVLEGKVTDLYSNKAIDAQINVINPFTSSIISTYNTDKNGKYWFLLSSSDSYRIEFSAKNYSYNFKSYNIAKLDSNIIEKRDVKLYSNTYVVLNVFDGENFQPLESEIKIIDGETKNPINVKIENMLKGRFKIELPIGKEYYIIAGKENYITDTLIFDIKKVVQFDEFEKDIELEIRKRKFTINVKDKKTLNPLEVEINIDNKIRKEKIKLTPDLGNKGKYVVGLREGDIYDINVLPSEGFAYYSTSIDLKIDKSNTLDVSLLSLVENAKLELNNIVFETNSSELTTVSYAELDRAVELMKANPKIKVEISAHSDNVGSDIYNLKLSEKRAQSVMFYIIDKGIPKESLIAKGYGESQPIAPNDTDENKSKNRRVELGILEVEN